MEMAANDVESKLDLREADFSDEAPPAKKSARNGLQNELLESDASPGGRTQDNEEPDNENDDDGVPTPENISMALCSMLSANPFGQNSLMRLPQNCPPNFFMNPAIVANQLRSSYMQHMAALSAAVCAKQNEQQNGLALDGTTVSVNSFNAFSVDTHSISSRSTSPANSSASQLLCVVCQDVSSGRHYGILACNGCSGFFKRSVRRRLIYRCQAGTGNCIVDKAHRNQCQACRLKKCLARGMNKDAVQNERQPRNSATVQNPSDSELYSQSNFLHDRTNMLSTTIDLKSTTPNSSKTEGNDKAQQPKSVQTSINPELTARMLYVAIKWVKTLPSFSMLKLVDQMTLLKSSWSDLFVLSAFQWSLSINSCPLFEDADNLEALRPMVQLFERFKSYCLDQGELTCLKAIILFRPETLALQDRDQVEKFQDQAQLMLHQHISRAEPNLVRFGRILLFVAMIRDACPVKAIEQIFLQPALGSNKVIHDVIADIHKN